MIYRPLLRALVCATFIAPVALYGCADAGSTAGGGDDASSSSSSGGASSGGTSSGGTSSGGTSSGGTSSGGTSSGADAGAGGGETMPMTLLTEIQKSVDYNKCKDAPFTNKSTGVTVRNLTVTSLRRYVAKTKDGLVMDGIYAQKKGGGHHGGLFVVAKGDQGAQIKNLKIGDVITVTGDNKGYYCAQQLDVSEGLLNKETATELPVASTVTVDKVGDSAKLEDNQHWENGLLQLENVTVVDIKGDKADYGNVYVGKDGSDKALVLTTVRDKGWSTGLGTYDWDTKKWTYNVKKGDKLKVVRGILVFSYDHWRLQPTYIEK